MHMNLVRAHRTQGVHLQEADNVAQAPADHTDYKMLTG